MLLVMKSSLHPIRSVGVFIVLLLSCSSLRALDTLILTNNQHQEGEILGVANNQIKMKRGPVQTTLPLAQVKSVIKDAPPEIATAKDEMLAGNAEKALKLIKPVAENFRGLPIAWARQASIMLGNLYLATDKLSDAEAAFTAFQKAYPDSKSLTDLGTAQIAIAKKDFPQAKTLLEPMINKGHALKYADSDQEGATLGRAFYLMGEILEEEGNFQDALSSYLMTVTIYYQDSEATAKAEAKADHLRKEKKVIVP